LSFEEEMTATMATARMAISAGIAAPGTPANSSLSCVGDPLRTALAAAAGWARSMPVAARQAKTLFIDFMVISVGCNPWCAS